MAKRAAQAAPAGVQLRSGRAACPFYPVAKVAPGHTDLMAPPPVQKPHLDTRPSLTLAQETETQYRVSFSRSRQKRGPPARS